MGDNSSLTEDDIRAIRAYNLAIYGRHSFLRMHDTVKTRTEIIDNYGRRKQLFLIGNLAYLYPLQMPGSEVNNRKYQSLQNNSLFLYVLEMCNFS